MRTSPCPIAKTLIARLGAIVIALIASLIVSSAAEIPSSRPRIVGHRGLLHHAPENTLGNFHACLELRLGFEFDVRRSQDGHLVCVHDETLDRTTNGDGPVGARTLAELKKLDAGSKFDPAFSTERIPTIDEIFKLLAQYSRLDVLLAVDLKGEDLRIESDVVRLATKHHVLDRLLFIGRAISIPEVRQRLRAADRKTHVAALANNSSEFSSALREPNADWVYVRYFPSQAEVAQVDAVGKHIFIAGPLVAGLEKKNWMTAGALGIDAILTDYPLALREEFKVQGR